MAWYSGDMEASQIKCGYCSWLLAYHCKNILEHECFKEYNENVHALNIDENNVATIVNKFDEDDLLSQDTDCNELSSQSLNTDFDERLITAVLDRPPLYDHRLNVKERSKLKKAALWEEVRNAINSNISTKELQKKWKYHRDCYIRARKKGKQYVPSGSSAASTDVRSTYRFFDLMRPLDDTFQTTSTISTLIKSTPEKISVKEKEKRSKDLSDCSDVESEICSEPSTSFQNFDNTSSLTSTSTSSAKKQRRINHKGDQSQQLQSALLDIIKMPITEVDPVDGFLKTLGETLHRLSYKKRVMMQIEFLKMATAAEFENNEEI
ncbi:uncharacterized protein LOC118645369 [Monomorium pharaonis]|uniref:uncharacterized protein LOC118645369 n=1 Tax=Monomorium pharaonis TaxID=307658 RepID=UPI0017462406|nr:uncharacterized protein LOC118645369 [Monomorium pharaonis]